MLELSIVIFEDVFRRLLSGPCANSPFLGLEVELFLKRRACLRRCESLPLPSLLARAQAVETLNSQQPAGKRIEETGPKERKGERRGLSIISRGPMMIS